ncbi:MAG: hypothetical protein Q9227_008736 [Pyrenula ochraceoflavens]
MDFPYPQSLTYASLTSLPSSSLNPAIRQIRKVEAYHPHAPSIGTLDLPTSPKVVMCALDSTSPPNLVGYLVYELIPTSSTKGRIRKSQFLDLQWLYVHLDFRNRLVGRILPSKLHPIAERAQCAVVKAWFPAQMEYSDGGDSGRAKKWMLRHGYDELCVDEQYNEGQKGTLMFHAVKMFD